jgi:hypothetical protein
MPKEQWTIVESSEFQAQAANFLTQFELDALKHQLVRVPFAGEAVAEAPWLRQLSLGRKFPAVILYSVSIQHKIIRLVEIGAGATVDGVDPKVSDGLAEVAKEVGKRGAGWVVGRGLWELIKKLLDIDD